MTFPNSQILVLVHPGSACGSADFNIGTKAAREARDGLCRELSNLFWMGILVTSCQAILSPSPAQPRLLELRVKQAAGHHIDGLL